MSSTRSAPVRSFFRPVVGIGLLALVAAGCQGKGDVAGKITYKDKPLVFGTVLFEGSDRKIHQAAINKDGSYSVRGVAAGEAHVAVNSPNPGSIQVKPPKHSDKPPERFPDAPGWFPVPDRYGKPSTSGLTYTVKRGQNTIDIDLK